MQERDLLQVAPVLLTMDIVGPERDLHTGVTCARNGTTDPRLESQRLSLRIVRELPLSRPLEHVTQDRERRYKIASTLRHQARLLFCQEDPVLDRAYTAGHGIRQPLTAEGVAHDALFLSSSLDDGDFDLL